MKPEYPNSDDSRLQTVLREWEVKEPLPPRFQQRVWQRIARADVQEPAGPWSVFIAWVSQAMARPQLAVAYVTVLMVSGLAAGYWHARVDNAQAAEQLGARYVQMMDPYRMPR